MRRMVANLHVLWGESTRAARLLGGTCNLGPQLVRTPLLASTRMHVALTTSLFALLLWPCREYVPDPSEPPNIRNTEPGVEFSFFSYWALNASQLAQEPSQDLWRGVTADVMEALDSLAMKLTLQGG